MTRKEARERLRSVALDRRWRKKEAAREAEGRAVVADMQRFRRYPRRDDTKEQ